MRVKIELHGRQTFGELLGLLTDEHEHDNILAVVRCDGCGLWLIAVHPSKVMPAAPGEEGKP